VEVPSGCCSCERDPRSECGPTGNLDTRTAAEMFELLASLNGEGKTVLYVTHDRSLAERAHRVAAKLHPLAAKLHRKLQNNIERRG
jgi:ABC-type ATPase involved in cell division